MSALTANRSNKEKSVKRFRFPLPIGMHAYKGGQACLALAPGQKPSQGNEPAGGINYTAGQIVSGHVSPNLLRLGVFAEEKDNSAGTAAVMTNVDLDAELWGRWFVNDGTTPVTAAMLGQDCYILDDQTVSADGTNRSIAGMAVALDSVRGVLVVGQYKKTDETDFQLLHVVRAVITSIASYAASGGVLTASAVGAIGAQDGVTLVAGDLVLLPTDKATAAKDAGPYVVQNPGSAQAKFVLARPDWYASGSTQLSGQCISVGGEGTAYGGAEWCSILNAKNFVVDTTDGTWYPRQQSVVTAAMVAGVSAANNTLYVAPTAVVTAIPVTPGGTQGILRISTQTAGKPGTSSLVVTSSSNTDTSTVRIIVSNW